MQGLVKRAGIILIILSAIFLSVYLRTLNLSPSLKVLYIIPSFWTTKYLSLGMEGAMADLLFIRTVLYLGSPDIPRDQWNLDWIYGNLDIAIALDPRFENAYFFGGIVVPQGEESTLRAIAFLETAKIKRPSDWQIPFWVGFDYYQMGDHLKAAQYYAEAAKLPYAPFYLKSKEMMSYYRAGEYQSGLNILKALLESAKSDEAREFIEIKIEWLKNIVYLEESVSRFKMIFNRFPKDLDELIKQGILSELPTDPWKGGYYWDPETQRVKSLPESN